jgi:hypothetical protein
MEEEERNELSESNVTVGHGRSKKPEKRRRRREALKTLEETRRSRTNEFDPPIKSRKVA